MARTTTITVSQIHCERCEDTLRVGVGRVEEVRRVRPDRARNQVRVGYDETTVTGETIRGVLADLGFDPVGSGGPDADR